MNKRIVHKKQKPSEVISLAVNFRYTVISFYALLNKKEEYISTLKGKKKEELNIPLKWQEI